MTVPGTDGAPTFVVLIMGAERAPWQEMELALRETWLSALPQAVPTYTYVGRSPTRLELALSHFDENVRFSPLLRGSCPWDRALVPRRGSGSTVTTSGSRLEVDTPEVLAFAGLKTLSVFQHLLSHRSWTYVWLGNTSTYVNPVQLMSLMRGFPSGGVYAGTTTTYGRHTFASGTGLALSRDVIAAIVREKHSWRHDLLVDVALGRMCQRLGVSIMELKRLDLTDVEQLASIDDGDLRSYPSVRCKSIDRPAGEIEMMAALHARLWLETKPQDAPNGRQGGRST